MRSHALPLRIVAILAAAALASTLIAADDPTTPPKAEAKFDSAETTLRSYFEAWKAFDHDGIVKCLYIDPKKKRRRRQVRRLHDVDLRPGTRLRRQVRRRRGHEDFRPRALAG